MDPLGRDNKNKSKKINVGKNGSLKQRFDLKWVITVIIWTFVLSAVMSFVSSESLENVNLFAALPIIITIIIIGIVFDIIGVAVTTSDELPFHSLASRRVRGAREAVLLIRNAEKVGSFCNDIIGDIAGIVSGSASAAIVVIILESNPSFNEVLMTVLVSALVSALTIGGKAMGKAVAFSYSNTITFAVARIISLFKKQK